MRKSNVLEKFNLKNKTIILTGSAGILGTQYSEMLCESNANVILVDTDIIKNEQLQKKLEKKFNVKCMSFNTDITKKLEIKQMIQDVIKKFKKIDGLINNAAYHPKVKGGNIAKPFESFPIELWNNAISVNLTGMFLMCQEIGKIMVKQKNGVIVNISSIYGMKGADQRIYGKSKLDSPASYAVTKGAILNLTRYLAAYWHGKNIRVNTLTIGGVQIDSYMDKNFVKKYSEKTILGRMAKSNEYNSALLFLLSDASSYMTGSNLVLDGGWTAW
jgi:NAD(P)-dependent dehydrogenase (short-subunit alcohol dehydrogenase family)